MLLTRRTVHKISRAANTNASGPSAKSFRILMGLQPRGFDARRINPATRSDNRGSTLSSIRLVKNAIKALHVFDNLEQEGVTLPFSQTLFLINRMVLNRVLLSAARATHCELKISTQTGR